MKTGIMSFLLILFSVSVLLARTQMGSWDVTDNGTYGGKLDVDGAITTSTAMNVGGSTGKITFKQFLDILVNYSDGVFRFEENTSGDVFEITIDDTSSSTVPTEISVSQDYLQISDALRIDTSGDDTLTQLDLIGWDDGTNDTGITFGAFTASDNMTLGGWAATGTNSVYWVEYIQEAMDTMTLTQNALGEMTEQPWLGTLGATLTATDAGEWFFRAGTDKMYYHMTGNANPNTDEPITVDSEDYGERLYSTGTGFYGETSLTLDGSIAISNDAPLFNMVDTTGVDFYTQIANDGGSVLIKADTTEAQTDTEIVFYVDEVEVLALDIDNATLEATLIPSMIQSPDYTPASATYWMGMEETFTNTGLTRGMDINIFVAPTEPTTAAYSAIGGYANITSDNNTGFKNNGGKFFNGINGLGFATYFPDNQTIVDVAGIAVAGTASGTQGAELTAGDVYGLYVQSFINLFGAHLHADSAVGIRINTWADSGLNDDVDYEIGIHIAEPINGTVGNRQILLDGGGDGNGVFLGGEGGCRLYVDADADNCAGGSVIVEGTGTTTYDLCGDCP